MTTPTDNVTPQTEQKAASMQAELARLQELVYRDELTGLLNRRGFTEEAERLFHVVSFGNTPLERRTGFQIPFSVIYVDLDNFKVINDRYGHKAGDCALKALADILRRQLRQGDLYARIGGEEFVVAIIGASAKRSAIIAEKLRKAVQGAAVECDGVGLPLTASFGIAEYAEERTVWELVEEADRAMYEAKKAGKNRVTISKE
jgi:diguanylate cyclase (GGDEF)-like protein